jgi:hypothetical protein
MANSGRVTAQTRWSVSRYVDPAEENFGESEMSLGMVLLIVVVLLLLGVIPSWPHSRSWGYTPSGVVGAIVIVLLVLVLTGRF